MRLIRHCKNVLLIQACAAFAAFVCARETFAQQMPAPADTRGLMIGAHLLGTKLSASNLTARNELASGVIVGYGITRWLMVFGGVDLGTARIGPANEVIVDYDATVNPSIPPDDYPTPRAQYIQTFSEGDYAMQTFDAGVRLTLPSRNLAWLPFVNVAFSHRRGKTEYTRDWVPRAVEVSGNAASVGAGVQYFINSRIAFEGGVQFSSGKFNKRQDSGGEVFTYSPVAQISTTRFAGGIRYYPHIGGR